MNRQGKPTLGILAGWQYYRTATNLSYLAPIFRGISRAAQDLKCHVLFGCGIGLSASPTDPLRPAWPYFSDEHEYLPIGPWNTDGLIIANPLNSQKRSKYVQDLIITARHPVLFIGSGEIGPKIVADSASGIRAALVHLIDHGHRQIAFIAGSLNDLRGDTGDRLEAYRSTCDEFGLGENPDLVAYGRHVFDGGYLAMQQIINSGATFTAVLASNDESALGAMSALEQAGRSVPQDVAVIGFDNRLEGAEHEPGLTSIHVPLFDIGYQAVDLMLQHISGEHTLGECVQVKTRLVVRQSCGCSVKKIISNVAEPAAQRLEKEQDAPGSKTARVIATTIMNQAHNLTEEDGVSFGQQLVDTFAASIQSGASSAFFETLKEVLDRTISGDDDAHIWQDAISILENSFRQTFTDNPTAAFLANDILINAREMISSQMQRQHRQYAMRERWNASRLSLLTAKLLSALGETEIYAILSHHLPDMAIHYALLCLFETQGAEATVFTSLRDVIQPDHPLLCAPSQEFPPTELVNQGFPSISTLIPLVDISGQTGYMVFGTEPFDLHGAIVQQVSGALNTARLYRQATEGQRLAEEANKMKDRFLSTISHELRTPLNLIIGLSGILIEESEEGKSLLPDPAYKDIERIQAYAQHLGGLIGDVLDLANSNAGKLRLNMEFVNLGEMLQMVAESGSQLAADKGLSWQADLPGKGPWVWGDRTRLRQVALNFIHNAIKFTLQGRISLSVISNDGSVTVRVQDTGMGVPVEEQSLIFEEFHRSERSISKGFPGFGLGLSICKTLIEMQGGTIGVESSGIEGQGSSFYFTIPTMQAPTQKLQPSKKPIATAQSVLVLTVRPGTSDRLVNLLRERGFIVQTEMMESASDWQSLLVKFQPDAILLDVRVDNGLGWDTLKAIRTSKLAREIPVMLYSTSQAGDSIVDLDYLTKPIDLPELTQALDQYWFMTDPDHPLRTFLVVDDDLNTLDMHARIVQSQSSSNRVLKAANGREALDILQQDKIDLVLLDLQMPEMDGFRVLEAMRENDNMRQIPVIVVTGKVLTEADMMQLKQGVAVVLQKGLFGIDETLAHITSALQRKRKLSMDAQRLVRQAMAYLHEHYTEQISRRDIAQHISITEDYLTFCFRQELGLTPIKYLQRYRLNQAKILLQTSEKTITEVALEVGFSDSGYFSRVFHREVGMTPEAFRTS